MVPLAARAYRHPALDDRVVVRVVAQELVPAEDAVAGYLGLIPEGEPAVVGQGPRQALGFLEWVLVHHPGDGHHALAVVPELDRAARLAKTRPGAAMSSYQELAGRLAAAVPHFLPSFYEQAGRVFGAAGNATYAGQMFTRARAAEAEYGLPADEDHLDAVFLEFALAGTLTVKALTGYARDLAARAPAAQALDRFTRLCVQRTAGGLPPSSQMSAEIRKLARAAGADLRATEQAYLAELLGLPATLRAPAAWWKTHQAALAALAKQDPRVRQALLDMMPAASGTEIAQTWLSLMLGSGAADALCDGPVVDGPVVDGPVVDGPVVESPVVESTASSAGPADGVAGWLRRFQGLRESRSWWGVSERLPDLYPLVERCAGRLTAELTQASGAVTPPKDLDLLDELLALGVPVADPAGEYWLRLEAWAKGDGQRELAAVAADSRFRAAFAAGADYLDNDADGRRALARLAASAGGRIMLAEWVARTAGAFAAAGLPALPAAIERLGWLPGETLALAPDQVRAAAGTNLSPVLARTLRAGLLDELSWPAWEEAAAALVPRKDVEDLVVADAWPHLIVAGPAQARVIGLEGTVLTHDLRIPARDSWRDPGFHYVDGELLVYWKSRAADLELRGYWHHSPGQVHHLEADGSHPRGTEMDYYRGLALSLPLPGGGRATGGAVLHRGDTVLPPDRPVVTDGTSYWVWLHDGGDSGAAGWHEYDPVSGQHGRQSRPASPTQPRNVAAEDGMVGFEKPVLVMPGDLRPRTVTREGYAISLADPDGVVVATTKTDRTPGVFGAGTLLLPPLEYWHCLQPRDLRGSLALRQVTDVTAAGLLQAAASQLRGREPADRLADRIRELLPEVTHPALIAGIVSVAWFAAEQQARLDAVAERLSQALSAAPSEPVAPAGPGNGLLRAALTSLNGRWGPGYSYGWRRDEDEDTAFRQIIMIRDALHTPPKPAAAGQLHLAGPALPEAGYPWWEPLLDRSPAVALRAATAVTGEATRNVLVSLLAGCEALGLDSPPGSKWRRLTVYLPDDALPPPGPARPDSLNALLPQGSGALLAFVDATEDEPGWEFTVLCHDPLGEFSAPAPYTVRSSAPAGAARPAGWLAAFLAELARRGPAPWFPGAAAEFAARTGVSQTQAALIVAGLPDGEGDSSSLSADARAVLGVTATGEAVARSQLRRLDAASVQKAVAALLPEDPAALWTSGPDAAAAAEAWNVLVGRRTPVPEKLLAEAARTLRGRGWDPVQLLPAVLSPATAPELTTDLAWIVKGDRCVAADGEAAGFTGDVLLGAVAALAWLAHRLPAGDPSRAALPAALDAVRARLASPGLLLSLGGGYVDLPEFREAAGPPTETGDGFVRYGAVILPTHDDQPYPAVRTALLDSSGTDPYLPALRGDDGTPFPAEVAMRLSRDPLFEELLSVPGAPAAGEPAADGTWYPQDPDRSVPDLVGEVAGEHRLSADAAAVYLMLLGMPDPTDRNTARWTGWKPARLAAARAELAATSLVIQASRARAGRALFLPGPWTQLRAPHLPLETWKLPLLGDLVGGSHARLGVVAPAEPAARLYARAWQRARDGDGPRYAELATRPVRGR
jgi:hypothetical protein